MYIDTTPTDWKKIFKLLISLIFEYFKNSLNVWMFLPVLFRWQKYPTKNFFILHPFDILLFNQKEKKKVMMFSFLISDRKYRKKWIQWQRQLSRISSLSIYHKSCDNTIPSMNRFEFLRRVFIKIKLCTSSSVETLYDTQSLIVINFVDVWYVSKLE